MIKRIHLAGKKPRGVHEYSPVIHASGYVHPKATPEELQERAEKLLNRGAELVELLVKPNGNRTIAGIWFYKKGKFGDVEDF